MATSFDIHYDHTDFAIFHICWEANIYLNTKDRQLF